MHQVRVRLHVAPDGTITGQAPATLPAGEHEAEVLAAPKRAVDAVAAREAVRRLQEELSRLPVLDARSPDEIIGYDEHGLFR